MRICPTATIVVVLDLASLHILAESTAKRTIIRMNKEGTVPIRSNLLKLIKPEIDTG